MSLFRKKHKIITDHGLTDVHSHLLPGIDDGAQSMEDSVDLVRQLVALGFKKLVTTPHIIHDFYPNNAEIIRSKLHDLKQRLLQEDIKIDLNAAAEYYLDEFFMDQLAQNSPLLTFGDNYILFETPFMNEPNYLKESIFKLISKGLRPVLAHPERYIYLHNNFSLAEDLINRGVLFQVNINSLSGYYSKAVRNIAEKFIKAGWVHFLGSDCHSMNHLKLMEESMSSKYFSKALRLPLLNYQI